jgi:Ca2+-binding EF-hand superfamily protein
MDSDGSGALDFNEFKKALDDYKVGATEEEAQNLFNIFDKNKDGTIVFDEFIFSIVGELNDVRLNLVKQAFKKLDANGNGTLEIGEIKEKFDPTRHPDVKQGTKTTEECRYEFFDLFSSHHNVSQSFVPDKSVTL